MPKKKKRSLFSCFLSLFSPPFDTRVWKRVSWPVLFPVVVDNSHLYLSYPSMDYHYLFQSFDFF